MESFVTTTLNNLLGVQVIRNSKDDRKYAITPGHLPPQLRDLLPAGDSIRISFQSPTPEGHHYLGRNHRFCLLYTSRCV